MQQKSYLLDVKQINITGESIHWGDKEYADLLLNKNNYNVSPQSRLSNC